MIYNEIIPHNYRYHMDLSRSVRSRRQKILNICHILFPKSGLGEPNI